MGTHEKYVNCLALISEILEATKSTLYAGGCAFEYKQNGMQKNLKIDKETFSLPSFAWLASKYFPQHFCL